MQEAKIVGLGYNRRVFKVDLQTPIHITGFGQLEGSTVTEKSGKLLGALTMTNQPEGVLIKLNLKAGGNVESLVPYCNIKHVQFWTEAAQTEASGKK